MKRSLSFLALMLLTASWISAAPARPGSFRYRQPDGTVLVLERHGDEYCHWTTDAAGRIVEQGADGFFRPAVEKKRSKLLAEQAQTRHRAWSTYETAPGTNFGERNILSLLGEFTDSTFVTPDPKTRFSRMLNESGYSDNGATGSVRDYYVETSHGQFRPVFDIYGPVQLSQPSAAYGQTDNGSKALHEACVLLDNEIDFSRYDSDGDGSIDMVLFYYAGHNEAGLEVVGVIDDGLSQMPRTHDYHLVLPVQSQDGADLIVQPFYAVSVTLLTEAPEVVQILSDLGCRITRQVTELVG